MELTTANRQIDDVTVVDIKGRIVIGEESAALRSLVADLLSEGRKKILFNLAEVRYIDSTGLGALVSAYTSVRKHNADLADLKLLNLSAKVQDVMVTLTAMQNGTAVMGSRITLMLSTDFANWD